MRENGESLKLNVDMRKPLYQGIHPKWGTLYPNFGHAQMALLILLNMDQPPVTTIMCIENAIANRGDTKY